VITNKNDTAQNAITREIATVKSSFSINPERSSTLKNCDRRIMKAKWYYLSKLPTEAD